MNQYLWFAVISSVVAIVYGLFLAKSILKKSEGSEKMKEISSAIREGAKAYLNRQYKTIFYIAIVLFVILWLAIGLTTALGFFLGAGRIRRHECFSPRQLSHRRSGKNRT